MKRIFYPFLFTLFCIILTNCQQSGSNAIPADLTGFTTTKVAGGTGLKAVKKDANGNILEEGILINGMRNGSWITYYPDKEKVISTMANYVNNELNGVYLTFSDRGQIKTLTTYANGVYDGNFAKFRFGNVEESGTYINGELDGLYKKFYPTRKIQMEAEYKNGKQHGFYKYYNEEGKVTVEYQFDNGEKIAGGIKE